MKGDRLDLSLLNARARKAATVGVSFSIMRVYVVEGNIGAGKSTALERLRDAGYAVVPEPVDRWIASGGLEGYYRGDVDPFTFQCHILQTKTEALRAAEKSDPDGIVVMERGFVGDANVFLRLNVDKGLVTEFQFDVYLDMMRSLVGDVEIGGIIYLDAPAKTCMARVKGRARPGEDGISETLLREVGAYYETVLSREANVLRVDAASDGGLDLDAIRRFIAQV